MPAKRCSGIFIFSLLSLLIVPPAMALRPYLATENAIPIDQGKTRLEIGFLNERVDSQRSNYLLMGELTYGLINNLDFEVEVPYRFLRVDGGRDEDGLGDVRLKTKIRFIKGREASPLSIAGQIIMKIPSCDEAKFEDECTGEADSGFVAIASKEFFPVTVDLNVGFTFIGNPPGSALNNVFHYSLGFDLQTVYEPLRVVTELAGANRDPKVDSKMLSILVGMIYSADLDKFVDLAFSRGLTEGTPDYTLTLGFSYYF